MKNRSMSGCVTVTGPPGRICDRKVGTTLPADLRTLPKRTIIIRVVEPEVIDWGYFSETSLVAPMMLEGSTALSVEISTNPLTRTCRPGRPSFWCPDVVGDRLLGIRFHQRHVLVGCGMKHQLGRCSTITRLITSLSTTLATTGCRGTGPPASSASMWKIPVSEMIDQYQ
ncbi:MAG: hypothetical protein CM1200mP2_08440 [Planctomycetaceae bacterium]|nr:MAG: hypothetical protein CM1200mP2_08440 [Planctomycetaceae bacterium]